MAKMHTSTIEIQCWKQHTCVGCGAKFAYEFTRKVAGQGATEEKASQKAHAAAEKALARDVDMQPCPTCGMYQPDMIGRQRFRRHLLVFLLAAAALAVVAILRAAYAIQADTATWLAVAGCGLAAALHLLFDRRNLNANLTGNQQAAGQLVAEGRMLHTPGRTVGPMDTPRPSSNTFDRLLAALLLVGSVALAAAPELMRSARGWPLNAEAYPPVVGPGDRTRIYMPTKISSIKGYWRGQPNVLARPEDGQGIEVAVPATTNENSWSGTIYAKSTEESSSRTPWVELSVPNQADLAGKPVTFAIDLEVTYPVVMGNSMFSEQTSNLRHSVTLRMAPPGAGSTYRSFGWTGTLGGLAAVLVAGIMLMVAARSLERTANPARTAADPQELLASSNPAPAGT